MAATGSPPSSWDRLRSLARLFLAAMAAGFVDSECLLGCDIMVIC